MGIVALVLFTAYLSIVLGEALPPRLLDPAWQIKVIGALVNASAFPLVGLTLLHLAADLELEDVHLRGRRRLASRLAIAASLGFLLLIPLQAVAIQRQQQLQATNQSGRVSQAEARLTALSTAIEEASSTAELQQRLQALEAPGLGPAQLAQPLPQVKAQLQATLRNAQTRISRQRELLPPSDPMRLLVAAVRNGVACLALAIGFAALANRPGVGLPMLIEWQRLHRDN